MKTNHSLAIIAALYFVPLVAHHPILLTQLQRVGLNNHAISLATICIVYANQEKIPGAKCFSVDPQRECQQLSFIHK